MSDSICCPGCGGDGRFLSECCNGSGGCSCRGEVVDLGACRVCHGSGRVVEGEYDRAANRNVIAGLHFLGSGPSGMHGLWPNRGYLV
jgi:hypothetical protein